MLVDTDATVHVGKRDVVIRTILCVNNIAVVSSTRILEPYHNLVQNVTIYDNPTIVHVTAFQNHMYFSHSSIKRTILVLSVQQQTRAIKIIL